MSRWTPERRQAQAEAVRGWRPWESSTGPTSPQGKARSCRNAYKGGIGRRCGGWPRRSTNFYTWSVSSGRTSRTCISAFEFSEFSAGRTAGTSSARFPRGTSGVLSARSYLEGFWRWSPTVQLLFGSRRSLLPRINRSMCRTDSTRRSTRSRPNSRSAWVTFGSLIG